MAPTKKKKPTRSERSAQRKERKAAAEAARGGFVGGSSRGDAASGSAGGYSKVREEQVTSTSSNGYPSLNLSTRVELFGLLPAIDEQTGLPYPPFPPSSSLEEPKAKQYPEGMVYNHVLVNDYHGLTDDLVAAHVAHDKFSYEVLAAAEKSKYFEQCYIVAEDENRAIKTQPVDVVDEMKKTFAKMDS